MCKEKNAILNAKSKFYFIGPDPFKLEIWNLDITLLNLNTAY